MKIAMYGGSLRHWGLLYPNALNEDVPSPGGTELAMMNVARSLARLGHQVTVFAECEAGTYEGVDYLKAEAAIWYLSQIPQDVIVSWQEPTLFLHPLKARLKVLMSQGAHLGASQAQQYIDRYFGISRYSATVLLESDPYVDPSRMWITRNGVDPQRFEAAAARAAQDGTQRQPHSLLWASSPDRGLQHLLPIFRLVRAEHPDATLAVAYNFDSTLEGYQKGQPGSAFTRYLEQAAELKHEPGVTFYQHLSQPKLADLMLATNTLVYPCDPVRPTETYCNVISEALAAGMQVFMSDADCLPENYAGWVSILDRPIDPDEWAKHITQAWEMQEAPLMREERQRRLEEVREVCSYDSVAKDWETLFTQFLNGTGGDGDFSLRSKREARAATQVPQEAVPPAPRLPA